MTRKGLKKLFTRPNIFIQDFLRKKFKKETIKINIEREEILYDIHTPLKVLFYASQKSWSLKKEVLHKRLKQDSNAEEYYRLAKDFEEVYNWIEASIYYKEALALKPYKECWALALGIVYERLENWKSAVDIYAFLHSQHQNNFEYLYRLSYVLVKCKEYKMSCDVFLSFEMNALESIVKEKSLEAYRQLNYLTSSESIDDSKFWLLYLKTFIILNFSENIEALSRKYFLYVEDFNKEIYFLLGKQLSQKGNYKEASKYFLEQKIIQKAYTFPLDAYENKALKKIVDYTEYYERHSLEEKMILYENNHAKNIEGEIYSFFQTLYNDKRFESYLHIWVLTDIQIIPLTYKDCLNVIFIKKESDLYLRYLTKAKYLINNKTFPQYFIRKEKQVYLNNSLRSPIYSALNKIDDDDISRNLLHSTHQKITNIKELFTYKDKKRLSSKKSILFYAGNFDRNRITTAFIILINSIDTDKYEITICLDPTAIKKSKIRIKEFQRIKSKVLVIPRLGRMLMTLEEKSIRERFESTSYLENDEMWSIYQKVYKREYRRIFGDTTFNLIVHFEGKSVFWQSIFAYGLNKGVGHKIIYQHDDMAKLWKKNRLKFKNNFILYREFDKIVSISEDLMVKNKQKLANPFDLEEKNFIYMNQLRFRTSKKLPLTLSLQERAIFEEKQVFINISRFSLEKNQLTLVEAFKEVTTLYSDISLILIGVGELEEDLRKLIKKLKLEEQVFVWNHRYNSKVYLELSDAVIVPSPSEKQPFIIREASLMKKKIIASIYIEENSFLMNKIDFIIENNKEGLIKGMLDFLDEKVLEHKKYNQDLLNKFYDGSFV
jgi:glycosyltransferase involved in cell wall biosynthesis